MTDNEKIKKLENAISSLKVYKNGLKYGNVKSFEDLKGNILSVLTENEKIKFSQIQFYTEEDDHDDTESDGLPF